jgi:hypothetical protein
MNTNLKHLTSTFIEEQPMFANALQVAGIAAIAVGAALIFIPAGVIVAGFGLVLFGIVMERE